MRRAKLKSISTPPRGRFSPEVGLEFFPKKLVNGSATALLSICKTSHGVFPSQTRTPLPLLLSDDSMDLTAHEVPTVFVLARVSLCLAQDLEIFSRLGHCFGRTTPPNTASL